MSSARCSAALRFSATTSQTGAGWTRQSSAVTAPRAGGQTPVSLRRVIEATADMRKKQEEAEETTKRKLAASRCRLGGRGRIRIQITNRPGPESRVLQAEERATRCGLLGLFFRATA